MTFSLAEEAVVDDHAYAVASTHCYFPPEMIGGTTPFVKGEEESLVWHAAAEACDSERVHLVWQVYNQRLWYLAVRSADLASHPLSWCPFAALLPGMPDAHPAPVIYTCLSDEAAALMAVDHETLQIIRGTVAVVQAKAERLSREWNHATIIDLTPDEILKLNIEMWRSLSLREDRARQFFALLSTVSAVVVALCALIVWFIAAMAQMHYRMELAQLKARTVAAVQDLQHSAMVFRTSDIHNEIAHFIDTNQALIAMQGWLKYYTIQGVGNPIVKWWAIIPDNVTADRIQEIHAITMENTPDGLVIANARNAVVHKGH